jgi:hypothetical protein
MGKEACNAEIKVIVDGVERSFMVKDVDFDQSRESLSLLVGGIIVDSIYDISEG